MEAVAVKFKNESWTIFVLFFRVTSFFGRWFDVFTYRALREKIRVVKKSDSRFFI